MHICKTPSQQYRENDQNRKVLQISHKSESFLLLKDSQRQADKS